MTNDSQNRAGGFCGKCGNRIAAGQRFCGKCGAPFVPYSPAPRHDSTPRQNSICSDDYRDLTSHEVTDPTRASDAIDRLRLVRIMCFVLAFGLCLLYTGLAGRCVMSIVTDKIMQTDIIDDTDAFGEALEGIARKEARKLFTAVVRGDFSGTEKTLSGIIDSVGSLGNDSYGTVGGVSPLLKALTREALYEARAEVKQHAGAAWPLLLAAAYSRELMIAGALAVVLAVLVICLKGGRWSGDHSRPLTKALAVSCVFGVLLTILCFVIYFGYAAG